MFFFNDTATTEIYTLSLHDALPISTTSPATSWSGCTPCSTGASDASAARRWTCCSCTPSCGPTTDPEPRGRWASRPSAARSEEHTSELQSRQYLVCRLLLDKKKTQC